jgi:hypothetical protein
MESRIEEPAPGEECPAGSGAHPARPANTQPDEMDSAFDVGAFASCRWRSGCVMLLTLACRCAGAAPQPDLGEILVEEEIFRAITSGVASTREVVVCHRAVVLQTGKIARSLKRGCKSGLQEGGSCGLQERGCKKLEAGLQERVARGGFLRVARSLKPLMAARRLSCRWAEPSGDGGHL